MPRNESQSNNYFGTLAPAFKDFVTEEVKQPKKLTMGQEIKRLNKIIKELEKELAYHKKLNDLPE